VSENDSVSMIGLDTEWKPLSKPPEDMAGQLQWLKSMSEEERRLKAIETQFQSQFRLTGNTITTTALIKEFIPPEDVFEKCSIVEDIPKPRALIILEEFTKDEIQQLHKDVQQIFPGMKSQEVTTIEGKPYLAFIGTDTPTLTGAVRLVMQERAIKAAIEHQSAKLVEKTTRSKNEEVTGTPMPRNLPKGIPVSKKTPQIV